MRLTVFERFSPVTRKKLLVSDQPERYAAYSRQIDHALERRDAEALVGALKASFELNRELVLNALHEVQGQHNGSVNGGTHA